MKKSGALILVVGGGEQHVPSHVYNKTPKGLFSRDKHYEEDDELEGEGISEEVGEKRVTGDHLIREAADVGLTRVKEWPETKRVALLAALAEHCGAELEGGGAGEHGTEE